MNQTLARKSATAPRKEDELAFHPSPEATLGVELELMILNRSTGDLAPGAIRILKACADESLDNVSAELMQTMIEVKTGVCHNGHEVQQQLLPVLRRVRNIASSMDYDIAMAGTHPFHQAADSAVSPSERYDRIYDRMAYLIHQRVVFGLHVHVGVPSGDMAIGIINALVQYLPHFLALSSNSPFWEGIDTGLASCRSALFGTLPHAGLPRYFAKWKDFRSFFRVMHDCHAIESMKDIYWDVRPRFDLGTIEFRICDMPATFSNVLSLVTLTRALVVATQRLLQERPQLQRGDLRRHWIAVENKWLATRYGLEAMYIRTPAGKRRTLKQDLNELVHRLLPFARENGDESFLERLLPLEEFETGADRQRRLYRESGDWKVLIGDITEQFAKDVEAGAAPAEASGVTAGASDKNLPTYGTNSRTSGKANHEQH